MSLRRVVPACVVVSERWHDDDPEQLHPQERAYLREAGAKRRAEFTTARRCARDVLAALGSPRPPMVPGAAGAPPWPAGIVGSITHCHGYRAAVAAPADVVRAVGIDAEPALGLPVDVLDAVASVTELDRGRRLARTWPDVAWDRLLFSTKEAVYKVWWPWARTWLDHHEAEVVIHPSGRFRALLARPVPLPEGPLWEVGGRWAVDEHHLWSAVTLLAPVGAGDDGAAGLRPGRAGR